MALVTVGVLDMKPFAAEKFSAKRRPVATVIALLVSLRTVLLKDIFH